MSIRNFGVREIKRNAPSARELGYIEILFLQQRILVGLYIIISAYGVIIESGENREVRLIEEKNEKNY